MAKEPLSRADHSARNVGAALRGRPQPAKGDHVGAALRGRPQPAKGDHIGSPLQKKRARLEKILR
ncbi:MAG: hypothetical protein NTX87_09925, partial [Planctomycetota bacterium]|nr:hypothetical protein [Planctomycetota bacterium]